MESGTMTMWWAVMAGGAIGSAARHGVNLLATRFLGDPTPYATAAVNMMGSLVIGLLAGAIAAERLSMSASTRAFVFVGLLGGFTTFSSFMLDSLTLMESGAVTQALLNLAGQLLIGLVLVFLGFQVGLSSRG